MGTLDDGTGSGKQAKIGGFNRVHTHSLSTNHIDVATMRGDAFDISTDLVTLTSANESALLYIKNNEDKVVNIHSEFVNVGTSTGSTAIGTLRFYINPTTGTIISNAVAAKNINKKISDTNTVDIDNYQGVEGDTFTAQTEVIEMPYNGEFETEFVLPKGASFGVSFEPATGNTSQDIHIAFLVIKNYSQYTID